MGGSNLFNEEYRIYLGLDSVAEIPCISTPNGAEALNQYRLYRLRKELENIKRVINKSVLLRIWKVEIEYEPPDPAGGEEKLSYQFKNWYSKKIHYNKWRCGSWNYELGSCRGD